MQLNFHSTVLSHELLLCKVAKNATWHQAHDLCDDDTDLEFLYSHRSITDVQEPFQEWKFNSDVQYHSCNKCMHSCIVVF